MFRIKDADALSHDQADLLPGRVDDKDRADGEGDSLAVHIQTLWKNLVLFD